MQRSKGAIVTAVILILVGVWYLMVELLPQVRAFAYGNGAWPFQIIGFGLLLALAGLLTWTPGLMIPASIVGGTGAMLYWQNSTGNWESWAYAWTLIPGFVGAGLILFGLLKWRRNAILGGLWCIMTALVLFGIFGSTLGGLHIGNLLWPVGLILLGLLIFIIPMFRRKRWDDGTGRAG